MQGYRISRLKVTPVPEPELTEDTESSEDDK